VTATPPPAPPSHEPPVARLQALDVLRAIAILLVIGRHLPTALPPLPTVVGGAFAVWRHAGWVGVDLFFVLSGFLVSGLLFREYQKRGRVRVTRFLVRRGFKIYPAFYMFLLITAVYGGHRDAAAGDWLAELFFFQSYHVSIWDHTWSLAIEEHFYLLLALAVFFIVRRARGFDVVVPAVATIGIAALIARVLTVGVHPDPQQLHRYLYPTHLRIDALSFGVLLSYWYCFHRERLTNFVVAHRLALGIASTLALSSCVVLDIESPIMLTIGLTLLYLGFGGVLLLSLLPARPPRRNALLAVAAGIGAYSYSIYLWHFAVQHASDHIANRALALAVYFVGSFVVGIAMAKLIERPFLALRDRLT
jgi:peptidoglycan/LPS O-acetylase OafA/YrhL